MLDPRSILAGTRPGRAMTASHESARVNRRTSRGRGGQPFHQNHRCDRIREVQRVHHRRMWPQPDSFFRPLHPLYHLLHRRETARVQTESVRTSTSNRGDDSLSPATNGCMLGVRLSFWAPAHTIIPTPSPSTPQELSTKIETASVDLSPKVHVAPGCQGQCIVPTLVSRAQGTAVADPHHITHIVNGRTFIISVAERCRL
jgi:hypothetical protein